MKFKALFQIRLYLIVKETQAVLCHMVELVLKGVNVTVGGVKPSLSFLV